MKQVSRQAKAARAQRAKGICPGCGVNPLPVDPRYQRDIKIRVAVHAGMNAKEVAEKYGVTDRWIRKIANSVAGKPRLMSRCESCQEAKLSAERAKRSTTAQQPGCIQASA